MFTGIIETMGEVLALERQGANLNLTVRSSISDGLKMDQSVSHNGVCLTVTGINAGTHTVTVIDETLQKTNLGKLKLHDRVNLERCLQLNGRIDGHLVQGHIDLAAVCKNIIDKNGSRLFEFKHAPANNLTVEKGSVCVNGISFTVVESGKDYFSVAVIPYTFENTNFRSLKPGDDANVEFDIIGKYVAKILENRN
jgi:riboflavin synthase